MVGDTECSLATCMDCSYQNIYVHCDLSYFSFQTKPTYNLIGGLNFYPTNLTVYSMSIILLNHYKTDS